MKIHPYVLNTCLLVLFLIVNRVSSSDTDCIFGGRDDCLLPCHCLGNSNSGCNKTTGDCFYQSCLQSDPSDTWIGHDWSGPKCQTGNVAYKKTAYLEEDDGLIKHDEVTDGFLSLDKCIKGQETDLQELVILVDLGRRHKLESVTLYLKSGNNRVIVAVAESSELDDDSYSRCGEAFMQGYGSTLSCLSIGQYVRLTIDNPNVTVCEISIHGHIYHDVDCSNCADECYSGLYCKTCKEGFQPPGCTQECPNGTYGYRCSKECGKCHNSEICDKATGNCDNGCERWYIHPGKCDLYIGKSNVVNNIYSPGHKTAFADSLAVILYRFRDRDTALSYNYLQKVEYAALHENYQVTDDRVFEGQIGVYGHQIYVRNLQPHTLYSLRTVVYRVWGYEQELVGYSAPVTLKTQCSAPNLPTLQVDVLSDLEILVSWKNASSGCDYIASAELFYTDTGGNGSFTASKYISGTVYSMTLDIEKDTGYYIKVRLTNNANENSDSKIFLYNPSHSKSCMDKDLTDDKTHENIPVYVFGLLSVTGVLLVVTLVLSICLFRSKNSTANGDHDVYSKPVPSSGYLSRNNNIEHHPYDAVL